MTSPKARYDYFEHKSDGFLHPSIMVLNIVFLLKKDGPKHKDDYNNLII